MAQPRDSKLAEDDNFNPRATPTKTSSKPPSESTASDTNAREAVRTLSQGAAGRRSTTTIVSQPPAAAAKQSVPPAIEHIAVVSPPSSSGSRKFTRGQHPKPPKPYNRALGIFAKATGWGAIGTELFYEYFTLKQVQEILGNIFDHLGMGKAAKATAWATAGILVAGDSGANFTFMSPNSDGQELGEKFAGEDGFFKKVGKTLLNSVTTTNGFITIFIPSVAALINFPIGSYADVQQIQDKLTQYFGKPGGYTIMGGVVYLGTSYYVMGTLQDTYDGFDEVWNNPSNRPSLLKRIKDGDVASTLQAGIEQVFANILLRPTSFAWLGADFALTTLGLPQLKIPMMVAGWASTVITGAPARWLVTRNKFFGTNAHPYEQISPEEFHEEYHRLYGQMPYGPWLLKEVGRALKLVGLAQAGLAGYVVNEAMKLIPSFEYLGFDLPTVLRAAVVYAVASTMYFGVYRNAEVKREVNRSIVEKKIKAEIADAEAQLKALMETNLDDSETNEAREKQVEGLENKIKGLQAELGSSQHEASAVAGMVGFLCALGTSACRSVANLKFMVTVLTAVMPFLSEESMQILALTTSIIVAVNNIDYFTPKNIKNFQGVFNNLGIFSAKKQQDIPEEEQSLLAPADADDDIELGRAPGSSLS